MIIKTSKFGWEYSSMVECVLSMWDSGLNQSPAHKEKLKKKTQKTNAMGR